MAIISDDSSTVQLYPGLPDDGIWRHWRSWSHAVTDAPTAFLSVAGLVAVATALGRRAYIPQGDRRIYANIWAMLMAASGTARKSSVCSTVTSVLNAAKITKLLLPQTVSPETLHEILSTTNEGLFSWPEYSAVSKAWGKNRNSEMSNILTDFFDSPPERVKVRKAPVTTQSGKEVNVPTKYKVLYPVISVIAGSTAEYINASADDIWGGYWARWLFVPAKRDRPADPWPVGCPVPDAIASVLAALANSEPAVVDMPRAGGAWDAYLQIFHEGVEAAEAGGPAEGVQSRLGVTCVKLAMILEAGATGKVPTTLSTEMLTHAADITRWHAKSHERWLGQVDREERTRDKVLAYMRDRSGGQPTSVRMVYRALHLNADTVRDAIHELHLEGLVAKCMSGDVYVYCQTPA